MNDVWYWQLLQALRAHVTSKHLEEQDAMKEIEYTEEYLAYNNFSDDEKVVIGCPWSIHCMCEWKIEGHVEFKLVRIDEV